MNGTVIEQRIEEVIAMGAKSTQVYKPKSNGSNKNLKHYTKEMIEYAKEKAGDLLHTFGYVDVDERLVSDNKNYCRTPFFQIESTAEQLAFFNSFQKMNISGIQARMKTVVGEMPKEKIDIKMGSCNYAD